MMRFFTAHARNGRLTLDEPTDLPEDTLLELVSTDAVLWPVQLISSAVPLLDADGQAALDRELEASIAEADAGLTFDLGEVLAELRVKHAQHEATRPAVEIAVPRTSGQPFQARVQNQRLMLDESTDLPDGTVVELVSIDDVLASGGYFLDDAERAALDRELEASFGEEVSGQLIDAVDAIAGLNASR
jgi:hypothetical protein